MKKLLSILLAAIMMLSAGAVTASAENEADPVNFDIAAEDIIPLSVVKASNDYELTDIQVRIIQDSVRYAINNRLRNISLMEAFIEYDMTQVEYDESGNIISYPDFSKKATAVGQVVQDFLSDHPEYFYAHIVDIMTFRGVYVKDDNSNGYITIFSDITVIEYPEPFGIYEVDKNGNYICTFGCNDDTFPFDRRIGYLSGGGPVGFHITNP